MFILKFFFLTFGKIFNERSSNLTTCVEHSSQNVRPYTNMLTASHKLIYSVFQLFQAAQTVSYAAALAINSASAETSQDIRRAQGKEKSGTLYRNYYVIKGIFVIEFTGEVASSRYGCISNCLCLRDSSVGTV